MIGRLRFEPKQLGENLAVTKQSGAGGAQLLIREQQMETENTIGQEGVQMTSTPCHL